MAGSNCCFLTCIQISQEAGKVVWYSHLFKNFLQFIVIHSQKLWHSQKDKSTCFSGTLMISDSSAFSKSSLNIWKFSVHVLLKPGLENFELYFASMWDECNCVVVWTFFGIFFLWDCNGTWPFPVLWPLWVFQICWQNECSIFTAASFRIWNSSTGILH